MHNAENFCNILVLHNAKKLCNNIPVLYNAKNFCILRTDSIQ
jgi:hypothetical protein